MRVFSKETTKLAFDAHRRFDQHGLPADLKRSIVVHPGENVFSDEEMQALEHDPEFERLEKNGLLIVSDDPKPAPAAPPAPEDPKTVFLTSWDAMTPEEREAMTATLNDDEKSWLAERDAGAK